MAETNAAALCEAGRRDAQALTVTGRRRYIRDIRSSEKVFWGFSKGGDAP